MMYFTVYYLLLLGLDDFQKSEGSQEEEMKKLRQQVDTEKMLKKEAVNKLTQIMYQRQTQKG